MTEPDPPDPHWPRYSTRPFPSYRFVPSQTPQPRRNPLGHSYGQPEPKPTLFPADQWQTSEDYLYGIDLYNFAYWWECHEIFEGLWHAAGRDTEQGSFFQAIIQLAAANLKCFMGHDAARRNLLQRCARRLSGLPEHYMGVNVTDLRSKLPSSLTSDHTYQLCLRLK